MKFPETYESDNFQKIRSKPKQKQSPRKSKPNKPDYSEQRNRKRNFD